MLGVAVYFLLMRHMTGEMVLAAVLTTIALGILLRGVIVLVWGAQEQHPLHVLGWRNVALSVGPSAKISAVGLTLVLATAAVYLGLWLFLRRTRWGIRMRAVGQNPLPPRPHVLFAGGFERYKGADVLLEAWPKVIASVPEALLTMIGAGTEEAMLRAQIEHLGIGSTVTMAPRLPRP